jgi:hypothetical protein
MHREQVAERLAEEAVTRQIVIFTHDLAFLFLLEEACVKAGAKIAFRWVLKAGDTVGICKPYAPPRAQGVEKALESLENDLNNRKYLYETGEHSEWLFAVNNYQAELRKLWERAVEDIVSPVVKRFRNKVDTSGLRKITAIEAGDCDKMREGYGRCSTLLHSDGDDLNRPITTPEKIQLEITAIKEWIRSIKDRQSKIKEAA